MPLKNTDISIEHIISALKEPLPGKQAHISMLPEGRDLTDSDTNHSINKSAVLILIYPEGDELYFCLTKRNSMLKHHPGQISFPGGRCENHETDPWVTSLRETKEEIGVPQNQIKLIGKLSEVFVKVSNFIIYPYIGFSSEKPDFKVNHNEVEALIVLPLMSILSDNNRTTRMINTSLGPMNVPCYHISDNIIWGATSMMIAELEAILKQYYSRRGAHSDNVDNGQEP